MFQKLENLIEYNATDWTNKIKQTKNKDLWRDKFLKVTKVLDVHTTIFRNHHFVITMIQSNISDTKVHSLQSDTYWPYIQCNIVEFNAHATANKLFRTWAWFSQYKLKTGYQIHFIYLYLNLILESSLI